MVCGPGEADRYLEGSLKEFKRLCDDAVIVGNNTDEKTEALIKQYGFWFYRDDREWGIHQPSIKTALYERVSRLAPYVVLPLDSDEQYDPSFTREKIFEYAQKHEACYFYIVNLWNDEIHHRKSLGFWNIRMFKHRPELGMVYQKKNLHCGLGPPWAYHYGSYIPHYVRHFGLMKASDRAKKVARYEKYDPQARFKDRAYYEALKTVTSGSRFDEQEMLLALKAEVTKMGSQHKRNAMHSNNIEDFVYVRRNSDGVVLDIPKRHLADTLSGNWSSRGMW